MNSLKLVTAPSVLAISLADVKDHLRVQDNDEDALITAYIKAAIAHAESFMGRALIDQTWDYTLDYLPYNNCPIQLPRQPVLEVVQFDTGESPAFDDYLVDLSGGRLYLSSTGLWPTVTEDTNAARIRFRAGYVDYSDSPAVGEVPPDILAAIKLIVGTLYGIRETVMVGTISGMVPWSADQLLRRHRIETSMA